MRHLGLQRQNQAVSRSRENLIMIDSCDYGDEILERFPLECPECRRAGGRRGQTIRRKYTRACRCRMKSANKTWYRVDEATALNACLRTVRNWIGLEILPARRKSLNAYLVRSDVLAKLARSGGKKLREQPFRH